MDKHLGESKTVNSYVKAKIKALNNVKVDMASLYELMFSERENILFEETKGYKIIKTSYGEAYFGAKKKASTLAKLVKGTPFNSVIAMHMENSPLWIETFWAILHAGFCPLLLNMRLPNEVLEETLKENNAILVISDNKIFSNAKTILSKDLVDDPSPSENKKFGEEIHLMSSGTSQKVKVVSYDASSLFAQLNNSYLIMRKNKYLKKHYKGELKLLTFLPFYHIFGLIAVYFWFGFFSRTFVKLNDFSPDTILMSINRHKVTHIFAVPLFWEIVYQKAIATIKSRGEDTYSRYLKGRKLVNVPILGKLIKKKGFKEIRDNLFGESISFLISGGGNISKETISFFNDIGYPLANGYGTSEIGITSVELSTSSKIRSLASVGKPFGNISYKINEEGELLVKGSSTAKYIHIDNQKVLMDDYFNTHDLAKLDKDGRYYILGRQDELIVLENGEKINPNTYEPLFKIEESRGVCLLQTSKGKASLFISIPSYLTLDKKKIVLEKAKKEVSSLNLEGKISNIVLLEEPLIRGEEFKLNRRRLVKEYQENKLSIASLEDKENEGYIDPLEEKITEMFSMLLKKEEGSVSPTSDFFLDLGGNSLEYYSLLGLVEAEFALPIENEENLVLSTPRKMADYIRSKL